MLQFVFKISPYMAYDAKVTVSLNHQVKHIVKIVAVQWQCKFQFVVCALGAVRLYKEIF